MATWNTKNVKQILNSRNSYQNSTYIQAFFYSTEWLRKNLIDKALSSFDHKHCIELISVMPNEAWQLIQRTVQSRSHWMHRLIPAIIQWVINHTDTVFINIWFYKLASDINWLAQWRINWHLHASAASSLVTLTSIAPEDNIRCLS